MSQYGDSCPTRADPSCIDKIRERIHRLPPKPEDPNLPLSMQQVVHRLYDDIVSFKALGYDAAFICQVLQEETGLSFRPHTLATYLSQERRKRLPRRRRKRPRSARPQSRPSRPGEANRPVVGSASAQDSEVVSSSLPAQERQEYRQEPESDRCPVEPEPKPHQHPAPPIEQDEQVDEADVDITTGSTSEADEADAADPFLRELAKNTKRFHRPRNPNAPRPWK